MLFKLSQEPYFVKMSTICEGCERGEKWNSFDKHVFGFVSENLILLLEILDIEG